MVKEASRNSSY